MTMYRLKYQTKIGILLIATLLYTASYYRLLNNSKETETITENDDSVQTSRKLILLWTNPTKWFSDLERDALLQQCALDQCKITNDRQLLNQSDAIWFDSTLLNISDLPVQKENQRWIFFAMDPPINDAIYLDNFDNVFNWTMTYRADSDIYMPYRSEIPSLISDLQNTSQLQQLLRNKKKMVAGFLDECSTPGHREHYIRQLQNHIPLDLYGSCGPLKCNYHADPQCYKMLANNYKFYLSFEKVLCRDYISSQFYSALDSVTVPIVYGDISSDLYLPHHSYIDVRNFSSVKELADYLIYLDRNATAYEEYFHWIFEETEEVEERGWCGLCELMHVQGNPVGTYKNIRKWWVQQARCGSHNLS